MEPDKKSKVSMIGSRPSIKSSAAFTGRSVSRMRMRKASYGFSGVAGVKNADRNSSQIALEYRRPLLTYLNTFQLDPRIKFNPVYVAKAAEALLDRVFADHKYNTESSPELALQIAGTIMRETRAMNFNRYRILAVVTIGQRRAQSYTNAVAFLWDHERDNYMNVQRHLHTVFVQITVFGVYLD